jgi:hypothetical protein
MLAFGFAEQRSHEAIVHVDDLIDHGSVGGVSSRNGFLRTLRNF